MTGRSSNVYIRVSNVEFGVYIAKYSLVRLDNSLEVNIDKEIVRVNVLFDKTFYLQECRKKVPFILAMVRPMATTISHHRISGNTLVEPIELTDAKLKRTFKIWSNTGKILLD